MAMLRWAMDSSFWDLNISTPLTLDCVARSVPNEPVPLGSARASRALRSEQLSLLGPGFPLHIIPSFSSNVPKELGGLALQSLLFKHAAPDWWAGFVAQFRPKKLISAIKAEVAGADEFEFPNLKNIAKHFWDKSLYSIGLCSQLSLGPSSSLFFSKEMDGAMMGQRSKAILFHKFPLHDLTLEAAWPDLFIDRKGSYWDVPSSISLDLLSLISESGLRYRFGIHKNNGSPQAINNTSGDPPLALMPGLYAKAAFSYEKSRDIWRQRETAKDVMKDRDEPWLASYDSRLKEPHAAVSGIIGGTCSAWRGSSEKSGENMIAQSDGRENATARMNPPFSADFFGSVCYTLQHGKFRKNYLDLTRMDARLDICSASAFIKGVAHLFSDSRSSVRQEANPLASPRVNLTLQQQIAGPIVFHYDSRFSFDSPSGRHAPQVEDTMYSLSYSLRALRSGKVVAWYSPNRKEGMIELRLFEF